MYFVSVSIRQFKHKPAFGVVATHAVAIPEVSAYAYKVKAVSESQARFKIQRTIMRLPGIISYKIKTVRRFSGQRVNGLIE